MQFHSSRRFCIRLSFRCVCASFGHPFANMNDEEMQEQVKLYQLTESDEYKRRRKEDIANRLKQDARDQEGQLEIHSED
jgi:hypothetical protein